MLPPRAFHTALALDVPHQQASIPQVMVERRWGKAIEVRVEGPGGARGGSPAACGGAGGVQGDACLATCVALLHISRRRRRSAHWSVSAVSISLTPSPQPLTAQPLTPSA